MKSKMMLILIGVMLIASVALSQTTLPVLQQRVNDYTNTLSYQEWRMLEKILKEFEDSTSTQIVILMVRTTGNESIEEYAYKVFRQNKIGQEGKNNGILLVIAKDDHKMKIEVGYGLEGVLTDAVSSRILRNEIAPHFKQENYFAGLITGIDAIMRATAGEYKVDKAKAPLSTTEIGAIVLFIIILMFFLSAIFSGRRRQIIGKGRSYYYSGWGFGGWSGGIGRGGSSFGGFRGGGGFSGGGGATGSW